MVSCNTYWRPGILPVSACCAEAWQEIADGIEIIDAATPPALQGFMLVAKLNWRIPMASWRSKLFAVVLGLVAMSFLAGPLSAGPRHHHHHHHHHHHTA
jgi:hypothetical protein